MARILLIPDYARSGGTLTFFLRLLEMHRRRGLETAVLIPEALAFPEVLERCDAMGARLFTGPDREGIWRRPYFSLLFDLRFSWRAFRSFRPDLVVASTGAFDQLFGVLALPVPVLLVLHTYPPAEIRTWKRLGMRVLARTLFRFRRNRAVTVSRFAANRVAEVLGIPGPSIDVAYNGARVVDRGPAGATGPVVLTIGHVIDYKNPDGWLATVEAVRARVPDARFVWLGDGPALEDLAARARERGLEDAVALPGNVSEVDEHYRRAAVYFQPSRAESHGIGVVEAMAHGLPCVTSDVGGLPESVVDGVTGFTAQPDDFAGFAEAIVRLLESPKLRATLGEAGRARARERFSMDAHEARLLAIYARLVRPGGEVPSAGTPVAAVGRPDARRGGGP